MHLDQYINYHFKIKKILKILLKQELLVEFVLFFLLLIFFWGVDFSFLLFSCVLKKRYSNLLTFELGAISFKSTKTCISFLIDSSKSQAYRYHYNFELLGRGGGMLVIF